MMLVHLNQEAIDSYLDGELQQSDLQSLLDHLLECDDCRNLVESRRALVETIRSARPELRAPSSLREKVTAILDTAGEPSSLQRFGLLRPSTWARTVWPAGPVLAYAAMLFL